MNFKEKIDEAARRISPYARLTYCEHSNYYSSKSGADVYLKLENLQQTGSFKARGALNKILSLDKSSFEKGIVTASTGNHGAATAFAASKVGATAIVFVSTKASKSKVDAIRRLGAEVREHGDDPIEAENFARRYANENGLTYISPYNDPEIVAGQGTIAAELVNQLDKIDAVFVALGGGGLISGVGGYFKTVSPATKIIGCSPENSKVMIESIKLGSLHGDLPSLPTLSDGTAGGIEDGSITFDLCRKYLDEYVTVTEEEIALSMREFMDTHHMQIEGAAAVAIASFLKKAEEYAGKTVVIVICGANIGVDTLGKVLIRD